MLGYPYRRSFRDFVARYRALLHEDFDTLTSTAAMEKAARGLVGQLAQAESTRFGKSKVFLTERANRVFEDARREALKGVVRTLQRVFRGHAARTLYRKDRERVLIIQNYVRRRKAARELQARRDALAVIQTGTPLLAATKRSRD